MQEKLLGELDVIDPEKLTIEELDARVIRPVDLVNSNLVS